MKGTVEKKNNKACKDMNLFGPKYRLLGQDLCNMVKRQAKISFENIGKVLGFIMLIDSEFPSQLSTIVTGMKECKFLLMLENLLEKGWTVVGRV